MEKSEQPMSRTAQLLQKTAKKRHASTIECDLKTIDVKSTRAFTVAMPKRNTSLLRFGQNMRKQREAKSLTQETLAERAELDRTYISDVERGVRNVSMISMLRIAKALGSTVSELSKGIEK